MRPNRFASNSARMILVLALLVVGASFHYMWKAEAALSVRWVPDEGARLFGQRPLQPPRPDAGIETYELPLRARGRDIVDTTGRRFKLASVNWYGASDELFVPSGLDVQHRDVIARTIRSLGFNSVRLPYSDEMVISNPEVPGRLLAANPDLNGSSALDVFGAVVEALTLVCFAVIFN